MVDGTFPVYTYTWPLEGRTATAAFKHELHGKGYAVAVLEPPPGNWNATLRSRSVAQKELSR